MFCAMSHRFIHSPLLFASLMVYCPTLVCSIPMPGPNSALKPHPMICMLLSDLMTFWIMHVVGLVDVMVTVTAMWHVHAQQSNRLLVDCDRRCNGTLADELRPVYSVFPSLVYNDRNSVFVVVFSSAHDDVTFIRLPYLFFF